jgi:putative transcriptional regulator
MSKTSITDEQDASFLEGQLLIAMPAMSDPRFARSVIYMCAHSDEGAMGLIINQTAQHISFPDLLDRLEIFPPNGDADKALIDVPDLPVHVGGPVETGRGFVLHSADYFVDNSTLAIQNEICLTATLEILKAIAAGQGPEHALLALGYAGWSPGQLESEIQANGWLNCPADPDIVFSENELNKYEQALAALGIDPSHLVADAGHA